MMMGFIWIPIILIAVYFMKDNKIGFTKQTADEILEMRLAKGEISLEEFRALKEAKGH